jgi:GNAT superfamily N-acetyltransferase
VTRGAKLRDGTRITIRPIEPEDRDALADGFERLSAQSRYLRFFTPMPELSSGELDHLTQVDHHAHEALVAVVEETGEGIAVARFVRTQDDEAEPAMAVADAWQRRGVATVLLDALADRAREEGIVRFRALVLAQNADAIGLLQQLGSSHTTRHGAEVEIVLELEPEREATPQLREVLREVAAGHVAPAVRRALSGRRRGP